MRVLMTPEDARRARVSHSDARPAPLARHYSGECVYTWCCAEAEREAVEEAHALLNAHEPTRPDPPGTAWAARRRGFYLTIAELRKDARSVARFYARVYADPHEAALESLRVTLSGFVGEA